MDINKKIDLKNRIEKSMQILKIKRQTNLGGLSLHTLEVAAQILYIKCKQSQATIVKYFNAAL